MAYAERRESVKGPRYRGFYKGTDGRYKSAGTYDTEERALEIARAAEKRAAELVGGPAGGLDPVLRATRTIEEYVPVFLRHHRVEGNTKVLPLLYLHGLSTGDFVPALEQFLGSTAGLSSATVSRLTATWTEDHKAFQSRDLSKTDFVYV